MPEYCGEGAGWGVWGWIAKVVERGVQIMSLLHHPFYNPIPDEEDTAQDQKECQREREIESLKHELKACKQQLKESVDDNEKYRKALLNLAEYVLLDAYKQETLKILGYTKDGLDTE
jgi:hypothetical protein